VNKILLWLIKHQRFIQLAIALITTGLAFGIIFINRDELARLLDFKLWNLTAVILVYILQFFVSALSSWLIINRLSGKSLEIINLIKIITVSRMANYLVPKSGGVYKAYVLKNEYKINYTKFIHIYAFFSWLTILINIGLVVLLILISMPDLQIGNYPVFILAAGLFLAILFAPLLVIRVFDFISPRDAFLSNISNKVQEIFITMLNQGRDFYFMVKLLGTLLLKFGLYVLLFKLLFAGMGAGIDISYAQIALFIAVEQINVVIFITPGNVGIMELLYGAIGGGIGIGVPEGVVASAVLRAIGYIVIFPFGIAFGGLKIYSSIKNKVS